MFTWPKRQKTYLQLSVAVHLIWKREIDFIWRHTIIRSDGVYQCLERCLSTLHSGMSFTSCNSVRTFRVRYVNGKGVSAMTQSWSIGGKRSRSIAHWGRRKKSKIDSIKIIGFWIAVCFTIFVCCRDSSSNPSLGSCQWISSFTVCVFHLHELLLAIARVTCLYGTTWPKAGHCTRHLLWCKKMALWYFSTVVILCQLAKRVSRCVLVLWNLRPTSNRFQW